MSVEEVENEVKMEQEEEEGEDEEETVDFGPDFNPEYFQFLIQENPEKYIEGDFHLNRPSKTALGLLNNPHGSAKLYQGDTCALCVVFGPTEVRMSKELPHRAAVDVLFRPKITGTSQSTQISGWDPTIEERTIEAKITGILESVLYLEDDMCAGFNIILHEFENDGCMFSTCVNATALALLNAACSMRCTFAAVTILLREKDSCLIVDPCQSQLDFGWDALVTVVFSNDGKVLYTQLEGKCSGKLMNLCLRQAKKATQEILHFQRLVQREECSYFTGKIKTEPIKIKKEEQVDEVSQIKVEDIKLEVDKNEEDDDDAYEDMSDNEDGEVMSSDSQ